MRHNNTKVTTIGGLVTALESQTNPALPIWFRGQANSSWNLLPSLARKSKTSKAESALIKRFKQNALPHLTGRPASEWEWMFLMQHYRLPTRLLDWTESPLTALYFAVQNHNNSINRQDGALWCLNPVELNQHANIRFESNIEIPAFDHDDILDNYLPSRIASETTSELNPIAAIALRNSPRIAAQLGTFTITHRTHLKLESLGDKKHVWRLIIPSDKKENLLQELAHLRINQLTLFPELDSVAAAAKEFAQ